MAKIKYFYNPHSLDFEKVKTNIGLLALRVFGFVSASIVFAAFILLILYKYLDSPKERLLKRELEQYKKQTALLDKKVNQLREVLGEMQERDASIYRAIFEADPISPSIRKSAFGGTDRYRDLTGFENSAAIVSLSQKVDELNAEVYIQSKSFDEIAKLAERKSEFLASIPAIQPISNKQLKHIASGYGYRVHPIYKTYKMHSGIDFTAPAGTPIYATGDGRVENIEMGHRGYGNHVIINHGFGYQSLYAHMQRIVAKPGKTIKRGELIGYVGNTGLSAAPHLHYEVIKNGNKVNPINYFFNDLSEEEFAAIRDMAEKPSQSFD
jgi:murein DD-endopeptidase MepM/ murein hydrolase activator NlpD